MQCQKVWTKETDHERKTSPSLSLRWTEPTGNDHGPSSDSAIGDPISIASSPSPFCSPSSSISRHRSTSARPLPFNHNASHDLEGVNRCLLPTLVGLVLPTWDNRPSITELARLMSDRRGVDRGTRRPAVVAIVVEVAERMCGEGHGRAIRQR